MQQCNCLLQKTNHTHASWQHEETNDSFEFPCVSRSIAKKQDFLLYFFLPFYTLYRWSDRTCLPTCSSWQRSTGTRWEYSQTFFPRERTRKKRKENDSPAFHSLDFRVGFFRIFFFLPVAQMTRDGRGKERRRGIPAHSAFFLGPTFHEPSENPAQFWHLENLLLQFWYQKTIIPECRNLWIEKTFSGRGWGNSMCAAAREWQGNSLWLWCRFSRFQSRSRCFSLM